MRCQDYESFYDLEMKLSPRSVYRYQLSNFSVSGKLVSCVCCIFFRIFLVQYIILWSDIAVLIRPDWEMLFSEFVKIWSVNVEVLQVILVLQLINCLKSYIEQNSLCFLISREKSLQWFLLPRVSLRMHFPFYLKIVVKC